MDKVKEDPDFRQQVQAIAETLQADLRTFEARADDFDSTAEVKARIDALAERAHATLDTLMEATKDPALMRLLLRYRVWRTDPDAGFMSSRIEELQAVDAAWSEALNIMQEMREEVTRHKKGR